MFGSAAANIAYSRFNLLTSVVYTNYHWHYAYTKVVALSDRPQNLNLFFNIYFNRFSEEKMFKESKIIMYQSIKNWKISV